MLSNFFGNVKIFNEKKKKFVGYVVRDILVLLLLYLIVYIVVIYFCLKGDLKGIIFISVGNKVYLIFF